MKVLARISLQDLKIIIRIKHSEYPWPMVGHSYDPLDRG